MSGTVPRVAFFTDSFHETNGVALTSRMFAGFASKRYLPFFSVHAGPRTAWSRQGDFETLELATSSARLGLERDLSFDLLFLRHRGELRRRLEAFRPDRIHVTGPGHLGMLGALLAHDLHVPLAASWHTNVHKYFSRRLSKWMLVMPESFRARAAQVSQNRVMDLAIRFYDLADLLFAPNPDLCEMLSRRCRKPVFSMHRGIDGTHYRPERRRRQLGGPFVIGYVGRISAEKNVRILVDVERKLRTLGAANYRFTVVGDGAERKWLQGRLNCSDFPGVLKGEALADAYADMDVLLFPSETDTFGNVILEAAASGVPALVTPLGGPRYLIEHGVSGYVCSDPGDFACAVHRLALNPELHQSMREAAREAALQRSWDSVFEGVYREYSARVTERTPACPAKPRATPGAASGLSP